MSYYAELDGSGIVLRVIVADDPTWIEENLGGDWVETSDPYAPPTAVTYAGLGMGYAANLPDLFAPQWVEPVPDAEGNWPYNGGEVVWHQGRLWRNVTEGVPNVWEPGVSGWHDQPENGLPQWIQPTGAHDAYPMGAEVTHNGKDWRSNVDANVWEPPEQWTEIDITPASSWTVPRIISWLVARGVVVSPGVASRFTKAELLTIVHAWLNNDDLTGLLKK